MPGSMLAAERSDTPLQVLTFQTPELMYWLTFFLDQLI